MYLGTKQQSIKVSTNAVNFKESASMSGTQIKSTQASPLSTGRIATSGRIIATSGSITTSGTRPPQTTCGKTVASELIDLKSITPPGRPKVIIFINMPAAGGWSTRRDTIRNTWLSTVKNYSIAYRFFTDSIDVKPEIIKALEKEREQFKDIEFIPTRPGYWLTHRYLFAMFWGYKHYDFKFYLKFDDDYFVCLNNLMTDIQYRMNEKLLYWGWFECDPKMVAMDEGFLILSVDLVEEIIKRNNSLCCHPFGGQMIAMWMNRLEREGYDITYFPDNNRLMHIRSNFKQGPSKDMCKKLLGIHQAYPKYMQQYWNLTKDTWFSLKKDDFEKVERKPFDAYCKLKKEWDWRVLGSFWRHEPKPCWLPGLQWDSRLQKYRNVQSREKEEK